jgi:hypothetical protein
MSKQKESKELIPFSESDIWGYRDATTGKIVIPAKYDEAEPFNEGLAAVRLKDKCGLIDTSGKEITLVKYESIWSFDEGMAKVLLNGKWGFIDTTGKEVIPLI